MEANKVELNIVVYNVVIEGLCKAGNIVYARDLFSHLSSKGVQPDVITYNIMIHGLCYHGLIIEAEKLLREMREKGCPPDGWIYNIIIRGLLKNNETSWVDLNSISSGSKIIELDFIERVVAPCNGDNCLNADYHGGILWLQLFIV
ncbi:hypothetical protein ACLB2K_030292 [Fragaria x ananassa]